MMSRRPRLAVDAILATAFLVAFYPAWTGLAIHEWLSVALIPVALVHLVANGDWVQRVVTSALEKLRQATILDFAVDAVLFVATITVMLSGLMVSRVVLAPFGLVALPLWHTVHSLSAQAVIGLATLHGVLHWRWFAASMRGLQASPRGGAAQRTPLAAHLVRASTTGPDRSPTARTR
jgi:hypothetical protein